MARAFAHLPDCGGRLSEVKIRAGAGSRECEAQALSDRPAEFVLEILSGAGRSAAARPHRMAPDHTQRLSRRCRTARSPSSFSRMRSAPMRAQRSRGCAARPRGRDRERRPDEVVAAWRCVSVDSPAIARPTADDKLALVRSLQRPRAHRVPWSAMG